MGGSRWGFADTYDHDRGIPHPCRNYDRERRNESRRTFQRMNRYCRRGVNCAVSEEVGDGGEIMRILLREGSI